jgi:uncharacterized cofD-like protein
MSRLRAFLKLLTPGIGVKRWLLMLAGGLFLIAYGLAIAIIEFYGVELEQTSVIVDSWLLVTALFVIAGAFASGFAFVKLSRKIVAPYRRNQQGRIIDMMYRHEIGQRGLKVVAIGGGTGLPSVLRGLKHSTGNITSIVTVADDGGSSGRLRRELGVLPPGDLRNNIAALADDENLMTKLFQYRFKDGGDLAGHAFGNLFIIALASVTGSIETALIETERVLNIQGRVLPATLEDVNLVASVRLPGASKAVMIEGESKISEAGGQIEEISLIPAEIKAYSESVQAILDADLVVIGPGSLYTSLLPNLLVKDIREALRATQAYIVYVCNIATQPGETEGYNVADHVLAIERHVGRGVFQAVLANNSYPELNAGVNTYYVSPVPENHEILQRYQVQYADLTDPERPWRHHSPKLAKAILQLSEAERIGSGMAHSKPSLIEA